MNFRSPAGAVPPHTIRPWPLPRGTSARIDAAKLQLASIADDSEREKQAAEIYETLVAEGTPLIEKTVVTFLWYGDAPHGIILQLNRITDYFDPADTRLEPVANTRLYALSLDLPTNWMGTYLFCLPNAEVKQPVLHGAVDRELKQMLMQGTFEDPTAREYVPNKHTADNPVTTRLAVARGMDAPKTILSGTAETTQAVVSSPVNNEKLDAWTWSAAAANADSPLLVFLDGEVWAKQYPIAPLLSQLVAAERIPNVHAIMIASGGPRQRQLDYTSNAEHSREFINRASGLIGEHGPLLLIGQSMGGLFSALAATRHPDLVAASIAQSPSFWWSDSRGLFGTGAGAWFDQRSITHDGAPILLQVGSLEWVLQRDVHHAAALLRSEEKLIGFDVYHGGHDALWWQALMEEALLTAIGHT